VSRPPLCLFGVCPPTTAIKKLELEYSQHEQNWLDTEEGGLLKEGWYRLKDAWIVIPESLAFSVVQSYHQDIHIGLTTPEVTLKT
jgi:hypothetical protein